MYIVVFTGIARLCCDRRKHVRGQALTYLQRALLVHDLQTLTPAEWENCFNKVRSAAACLRQLRTVLTRTYAQKRAQKTTDKI